MFVYICITQWSMPMSSPEQRYGQHERYIPVILLCTSFEISGIFFPLKIPDSNLSTQRDRYSACYLAHSLQKGPFISFCLFPFTFGLKHLPEWYLIPSVDQLVLSYIRINRFAKSCKIMANEACRNMQIALVGRDYPYYII